MRSFRFSVEAAIVEFATIHAGVAVQPPAGYPVPAVVPASLAPTAEVTSRAVEVAKAGKADWVDM